MKTSPTTSALQATSNTNDDFAAFLARIDHIISLVVHQNPVPGTDYEDLMQESRIETFIAWSRYGGTEGIDEPEGLAARITQRVCIKAIKRAQRERQTLVYSSAVLETILDNMRAVDNRWNELDDLDCLAFKLNRLPVVYRQMIEQRFYKHQTYNQIGQALEINTSTAKRRIDRALEVLRAMMG